MDIEDVRKIALSYDGVEEKSFRGWPGFNIRGKPLCRLWDDNSAFVIRVTSIDFRDMLLEAEPGTFFITDHYRNSPYLLARSGRIGPDQFRGLFEATWRQLAPRRLIAGYDARHQEGSTPPGLA